MREQAAELQPLVENHVTVERVRTYLQALSEVSAPSTAAAALRGPVLSSLLESDGLMDHSALHFHQDFERTGNVVISTGENTREKPLWYFAHLDTLSYLAQPRVQGHYPLVAYGYHLIRDGDRSAAAYRFDLGRKRYEVVARGRLGTVGDTAAFWPHDAVDLKPGDRVVLETPYRENLETGDITAHIDNAGAVAALAVAAGVFARAGIDALLAFPDEEEGPSGAGNQTMGRGASRIVGLLPPPDLAIVGDVQQAGGHPEAHTEGGIENSTRVGQGAVLSEFSSFARGAVTPPHLYVLAERYAEVLRASKVRIQRSNNAYTSRSDDVGVMLRTPNILLLGFCGFNRHFDLGEPRANLHDVVDLAKAFVYVSALRSAYRDLLASMDAA